MKFLVATYGGKHIGMLLAHLHAVRRTHPGAAIEVYHQDLPAPQFEAMKCAWPDVSWIETQFDLASDKLQRISSKTLAWEMAIRRQEPGETVCLLDVDTLVRKDLSSFFSDPDCDVVFTYKSGGFVLNTGVLLCRINPRTLSFFERWRADTIRNLTEPERYRQANDPALPYGAADQMALNQVLGYREDSTSYEIVIGNEKVRFRGEPCAVLNETRSCPIEEQMHVIHYKGGWQLILLEGRGFSKNRPRSECWEMYLFYLSTFQEALRHLNDRSTGHWQPRDFHLPIPRYVGERNPLIREAQYAIFVANDSLREILELFAGVGRVLRRKISASLAR